MVKPINNLTIATTKRNQRFQGSTSSTQQNVLQDEVIRDLINLRGQWNNGLVPLLSTVPAGEDDPLINAFTDGLSGETLYAQASATSAEAVLGFYNTDQDRPNTIYEQFVNLYDYVNQQITGGSGSDDDDDDTPSASNYIIVETTGARDSLTEVEEGTLVYVKSTNRIYILDADLTTWNTYRILPNFKIKDELATSLFEMAFLYVSSSGNDETGVGSEAAPFATIQRCIDAIPPHCKGYIQVQFMDAGPFVGDFYLPDLQAREYLNINFVGAGDSVLDMSGMPAGTRDINTAGGNKSGRFRHVVGAHGTLTNSSHWIRANYAFGDEIYYVGAVIDGANSSSPDISIVSNLGIDLTTLFYSGIDLVPYTTVLEPAGANTFITMSATTTSNQSVTMNGLFIDADIVSIEGSISLLGCYLDTTRLSLNAIASTDQAHVITNTGTTFVTGVGQTVVQLSGLFLNTIYLGSVFCYLNGIFRNTSIPKIQVGYGSLSHPRRTTSCLLNGDMEQASIVDIYVIGGSLRIYDDGSSITADGTSTSLISMWNHSDLLGSVVLPSLYGSTTGIPISLRDNSSSEGLIAAGYGSAPYIRNTTNPGQDIGLGSGTSTLTLSFADLPATDLITSSRAG